MEGFLFFYFLMADSPSFGGREQPNASRGVNAAKQEMQEGCASLSLSAAGQLKTVYQGERVQLCAAMP
jgi:hypothetical protein